MSIKKLATLLLTVTIVTGGLFIKESNAYSYQSEKNTQEENMSQEEIDELAVEYGLTRETDSSVYEEGKDVQPVVIHNKEELEEIFKVVSQVAENIENMDIEANINNVDGMARASQSATFSKGLGLTIGKWSSAKFNTHITFDVKNKKINKVLTTNQSLTGYVLGLSLTKVSTNWTISSNKASAKVVGKGIINSHLIVEGGPVIYNRSITATGTYHAK